MTVPVFYVDSRGVAMAGAMIPRALAERKAPYGATCTSCGLCCLAELCQLAQHVFKRPAAPGPCPALLWENGKDSRCGLVVAPEKFVTTGMPTILSRASRVLIGTGTGCDCKLQGETNDEYSEQRDAWGSGARRSAARL